MSGTGRPRFVTRKRETGPDSPEALFAQTAHAKSHGYLRGPQQDVLRSYMEHVDEPNIALELPTGTGKTAVGLLIADWRRRRSEDKAAYLALTNQLAHQVMEEGRNLGIPCADLTGAKHHRSKNEEGKYLDASAVGITTYSNLFNINPVIQASDVLVLDDAHGGEQFVSGMWTVEIDEDEDPNLFDECYTALRPLLTSIEHRRIADPLSYSVESCDLLGDAACIANLTEALDGSPADGVRFSWPGIRNNLAGCVVLVSAGRIVIRPIIPPTETHEQFASTGQRILMSATLGDPGDLKREYGLTTLETLKAQNPQWGHRYIFIPEMHTSERYASAIVAAVWSKMEPKRAVFLAPSRRVLKRSYEGLVGGMKEAPDQITAGDIAESLGAFTENSNAMLTMAGRYDGLDLPDEDCRLLIMAEAPSAVSDLERHLRDRWRMGPLMRRRELTRLVQGLGRCTRNSTDYSVVFWLGQSLVNAAADARLLAGLPNEVAAELKWGIAQSSLAGENPEAMVSMALSLLDDEAYRLEANEAIGEYEPEEVGEEQPVVGEVEDEVQYSRAMWSQDFAKAYAIAREIADRATDAGYRAWWWYLASAAAGHSQEKEAESDCLRRAIGCNINSGWLRRVSQQRGQDQTVDADDCSNAESVWQHIDRLGWAGPTFRREMDAMEGLVKQTQYKQFHQGLERLGRCLGAQPLRPNEQGAPDVVWSFDDEIHIVFEAKSEKAPDSFLSKDDVLQAGGHVNWVLARLVTDQESARIMPVIVSPASALHHAAEPHRGGLYWMHTEAVSDLARTTYEVVSEIRTRSAGRDFGPVKDEVCARLKQTNLHVDGLMELLTKKEL